MTQEEQLAVLRRLTEAFGPSGCEGQIAEVIEKLARPYGDEITRDPMGNLIVHKKGEGKNLMFSAHMDSIGLMVTQITDQGYLKFAPLGGFVPSDLSRVQVVFENGAQGVIGVPEDKEEKSFKLEELYIDIGASSKEEVEKLVKVGDCAVYRSTFFRQGDRLFANYLDNRSGCLVLLDVLSRVQSKHDLYFVFTAQEEVGVRGAKTAAYAINPDYGVAVDVTCTDDLPGASHTCTSKLGGGAAVKIMDRSVLCSPEVCALLKGLAEEKNIPAQEDIMSFGGTDAGAILPTRCGVLAGGISVPCRYTHAPIECISLKDLQASADLAAALAESELN